MHGSRDVLEKVSAALTNNQCGILAEPQIFVLLKIVTFKHLFSINFTQK